MPLSESSKETLTSTLDVAPPLPRARGLRADARPPTAAEEPAEEVGEVAEVADVAGP